MAQRATRMLKLVFFLGLLRFLTPKCNPRSKLIPVVSQFFPHASITNVKPISDECHFVASGFYDRSPGNVSIFVQCRQPSVKKVLTLGEVKVLNVITGKITPFLSLSPFSYKIVMLRDGGRVDFTYSQTELGFSHIFRRLNRNGTEVFKLEFLGGADMNNMFYDEETENVCLIMKMNMCFYNRSVDVLCGDNLEELQKVVEERKPWYAEYSAAAHKSSLLVKEKKFDVSYFIPVWEEINTSVTISSSFDHPYYPNASSFKKGGNHPTELPWRSPDIYTLSIFKKRNDIYYGLVYLHDGLEGYPKLMRPFLYCANSTHFVISQTLILNDDYFKYMMVLCADGVIGNTLYCSGVNPSLNPSRRNMVWYEHDRVLLTIKIPTLPFFENSCFNQNFGGKIIRNKE